MDLSICIACVYLVEQLGVLALQSLKGWIWDLSNCKAFLYLVEQLVVPALHPWWLRHDGGILDREGEDVWRLVRANLEGQTWLKCLQACDFVKSCMTACMTLPVYCQYISWKAVGSWAFVPREVGMVGIGIGRYSVGRYGSDLPIQMLRIVKIVKCLTMSHQQVCSLPFV